MSTSTQSSLAHLLEALRAHRQRLGAGKVPAALTTLEAELLSALSGTQSPGRDSWPTVGHRDRVLLNEAEAAELLAISQRQVRKLRASGELRAVTIGSSVRYRPEDLNEFASANQEGNK